VISPSVLSYSPLHLKLFNVRILDLLDNAFGTYGIKTSAAFTTLITWFMDNKKIVDEINRYGWIRTPYWNMSVIRMQYPHR
jgi:SNF family Na+-dependent transporter